MKLPAAAAFMLLAVLAAGVEAGPLPQPVSLIQRPAISHPSHGVRDPGRKSPEPMRLGSNDRHRNTWPTHGVRGK